MKIKEAVKLLEEELKQLNVSMESRASQEITSQVLGAYDIMSKKELKDFIQELHDNLPHSYFQN